jgi:leucyl-tRNA synthetase
MTDRYDFREIEAKWQKRWEEAKLFETPDASDKPKFYGLEMFPYPSGAGLSVGHIKNYAPMDTFVRYKRMKGFNVLYPMGWDAFGQPAENEAIKRGRNPREMVPEYAANYKRTLQRIGSSYDWSREINSSLPDYYKWTQWIFLLLYKRGLAFRANAPINWCPSCKTGLANEEVKEGRCWRCDSVVEKRPMPQWYFKITAYGDRLISGLDTVNWPDGIKQMQREWIGRSEGANVDFRTSSDPITVYTTRPDTLWGATFMVLAPEHPLVAQITTDDQRAVVEEYVARASRATDIDRMSVDRAKTGVFTGAYATNPVNGKPIPVWIADYVLTGYGTGAIMAVPAHDQRDFEFARKYELPIELVYVTPDGPQTSEAMTEALPHDGAMRDFSGTLEVNAPEFPFTGSPNDKTTVSKVVRWLEERGVGEGKVNYKIRDWLISRQRYWGAPIPIVHCVDCGEVAVPDDQLPVLLPDVDNYQPSGTGESPLATIPEFVNTTCPQCGKAAKRETDTMGGFACSSWYFLRYADPKNSDAFASRDKIDNWLPVDLYVGGAEHAVMHLLYARFWTKVLFDAGLVGFEEPFQTLRNQGSMLAYTPGRRPRTDGETSGESDGDSESVVDWIVLKPEERANFPEDQIVWRWVRMSKSKGNVVSPDDICERYGADSLRLYEMFVAPYEDNVQWNDEGIHGAHRFANRVWRWLAAASADYDRNWKSTVGDVTDPVSRAVRRKLHQTIRKVGDDLESFRFNTAIAAMMELVNDLYGYRPVSGESKAAPAVVSEAIESLTLIISPFAPHMSDEVWQSLRDEEFTQRQGWPVYDEAAATEDEIEIIVQINGKLRDKLVVPSGAIKEQIEEQALALPKVQSEIEGKTIRKVITVPGKLVNVVVG